MCGYEDEQPAGNDNGNACVPPESALRPADPLRADERGRAGGILVLAVLALIVYGPTVGYGYFGIDDAKHLLDNPVMGVPGPAQALRTIWSAPYFGLYVPVTYTFWWFLSRIAGLVTGGPSPAWFHGANVCLHALNTILLYLILRRLVPKRSACLLGALVFLLHPLQVEAVAWISEFRGLLSAGFMLGAILAYLCSPDGSTWRETLGDRRWLLSLLLGILALLSKPSAVALPLILGSLQVFRLDGCRIRPARLLRPLCHLLPVFPVVLVTRSCQSAGARPYIVPLVSRLIVAGDALRFYLSRLLAPLRLAIQYDRSPTTVLLSNGACAAALATLAFVLLAILALWRRRRGAWLAPAGAFLGGLVPVLGIIPFGYQYFSTTADRYAYMPMFGAALFAAIGATRLRGRGLRTAWVWPVLLGILTVRGVHRWRDNREVFEQGLRVYPESVFCLHNLGKLAIEEGDFDEARVFLRKALSADPHYPLAYLTLGMWHERREEFRKAAACYEFYLQRKPDSSGAVNTVAVAWLQAGSNARARKFLERGLRQFPDDPDLNYNLGNLLLGEDRPKAALRCYEAVLRARPKDRRALTNAGKAAASLGKTDAAIDFFAQVLRLDPENALVLYNLGNAWMSKGRAKEAARVYGEAVGRAPTPELCHNYGIALLELGDTQGALNAFREMARLAPEMRGLALYRQGAVYEAKGELEQALVLYRQALDADPPYREAADRIQALKPRNGLGPQPN